MNEKGVGYLARIEMEFLYLCICATWVGLYFSYSRDRVACIFEWDSI